MGCSIDSSSIYWCLPQEFACTTVWWVPEKNRSRAHLVFVLRFCSEGSLSGSLTKSVRPRTAHLSRCLQGLTFNITPFWNPEEFLNKALYEKAFKLFTPSPQIQYWSTKRQLLRRPRRNQSYDFLYGYRVLFVIRQSNAVDTVVLYARLGNTPLP